MKLPPLILASASPRRVELLRLLKVDFQVMPGSVAEVAHEHLSPLEVCQLNAHRKAFSIAKRFPDALVLGADTLVFLDNEILGKPENAAQARSMLGRLQGRSHQVVTGVSLIHLRQHQERIFADSTDVLFHPLDAEQISGYVAKVHTLDKAGAYAVQEFGEMLISEISGSFSNVVGLPVELLRQELEAWGKPRRSQKTPVYASGKS